MSLLTVVFVHMLRGVSIRPSVDFPSSCLWPGTELAVGNG